MLPKGSPYQCPDSMIFAVVTSSAARAAYVGKESFKKSAPSPLGERILSKKLNEKLDSVEEVSTREHPNFF